MSNANVERVVVTGSVSPREAAKATRYTTYSVRTVPVTSRYILREGDGVGGASLQEAGAPAGSAAQGDSNPVDELRKYIDASRTRLLEDPRTRQMIERGEATWDEVKTYLREHGPQHQGPSGPISGSSSSYTYSAGYWYPLTHGGAFTAAPNTVFEVACGDPEATKRISLRPQVDVVFDAKASQLVFAFDLPGFEKKDVSVEVENRCIAVSGDRPRIDLKAAYGDDMKPIITERNFGFFFRRFQLPANAIEDTVSASMENGVLFVRISTTSSKSKAEKKRINID
ncbi:hypothetical protein ACSSS7_005275 [Eimeria intestinalis]